MGIASIVERLIPDLSATLVRFPVAAAVAVLLWLYLVIQTLNGGQFFDDDMIAGSAAVFLASGAAHFFGEGRASGRGAGNVLAAAAGLAAGALALLAGLFQTSLLQLLPALALAVMIAAYLRPGVRQGAIWLFNLRFGLAALLASIVGVVFGAGLSAIVEALRFLFDAPLPSRLHEYIWATALSLVGPFYGLSLMPRHLDEEVQLGAAANTLLERGVSVLVNFVLVPMILVYALILHAYAIKIALQWELPKGQIGTMVTIFALGGTGAWLVAWPWRDAGTLLLRLFIKGWFWITITPAALLVIAVWRRVSDYGVTPERYALVLVAIWLAGLAVYLAIRRNRADMRAILGGLAVLLLAGSFGPWGANGLTITSQFSRLAALLEQNGLLRGDRAVQPAPELDNDSRQAGYSMIQALREADGLGRLQPWFADAKDNPFKDANVSDGRGWFAAGSDWTLADTISRQFGFLAYVPPAEYVSFVANTVTMRDVPAQSRLVGPLQVYSYPVALPEQTASAVVKEGRLVLKVDDREWSADILTVLERAKAELAVPPKLQPPLTYAMTPEVSLVFDSLGGQLGDKPQLHNARVWVILQQQPGGQP